MDNVTHDQKVVARSSALGEDSLTSSAAGQYVSVTNITSPAALEQAIIACFKAYNAPSAVRYRQSRNLPEGKMNVLVQPHISGLYSGVAFSRDPMAHAGDVVVIEALPGEASQVVSGKITPERYQVVVSDVLDAAFGSSKNDSDVSDVSDDSDASKNSWQMPSDLGFARSTGQGINRLPDLIQTGRLSGPILENRFHGYSTRY